MFCWAVTSFQRPSLRYRESFRKSLGAQQHAGSPSLPLGLSLLMSPEQRGRVLQTFTAPYLPSRTGLLSHTEEENSAPSPQRQRSSHQLNDEPQ
ncbi:hypothetical protein CHARACLAT_007092 [Characodon lateralis]|uniref:Uncharacterized protein n=1 Tax=Characodon lateralis TaxID=208331 RepID=A0ABU7EAQ4_9TELE|nr:hypothetical protein [Characodon lateralis]